jgi:hypothetical protein
MISYSFSFISGHFGVGLKVKPKDLQPSKNIEMTVFQISPLEKMAVQ